jgi:hypothetical protein
MNSNFKTVNLQSKINASMNSNEFFWFKNQDFHSIFFDKFTFFKVIGFFYPKKWKSEFISYLSDMNKKWTFSLRLTFLFDYFIDF